jgi:hypothetical protein
MKNKEETTKYNPFYDPNFWIAFTLGGGWSSLQLVSRGFFIPSIIIPNLTFFLSWVAWIIYKKGRKGSLLVGFLIAITITSVVFFATIQHEQQQFEEERMEAVEAELEKNYEKMLEELEEKQNNRN